MTADELEVQAITARLLTGVRVRHIPTGRFCRLTGEVSRLDSYEGWCHVVMEDNGLNGLLPPNSWEPA